MKDIDLKNHKLIFKNLVRVSLSDSPPRLGYTASQGQPGPLHRELWLEFNH